MSIAVNHTREEASLQFEVVTQVNAEWQAPKLTVLGLEETRNGGSTISDGHPFQS